MQQNKGIDKISAVSDDEGRNADTIFHNLSTMKIARISIENVEDVFLLC